MCLKIEFSSIKYMSREKVDFGTANTDGSLKEFKLDSIQCCKNNDNFYSSKHQFFKNCNSYIGELILHHHSF